MKLIINGDDFGLTKGVSEGIIKAMKDGILGDTTAMVNMPYFEESIKIAKENGIEEMGIHLTLTCGRPILDKNEVPTICDKNGNFYRQPEIIPKDINIKEVEKEIRAQINKFKQTGMKLNHIDGHHHFYIFNDEIFNIVINIAKELNVPMRCPDSSLREILLKNGVKTPEYFEKSFYGEDISVKYLIGRLDELKNKYSTIEFMVHPSIKCDELTRISSYNIEREKELEILTSDKIKNYIKDNGIEICNYGIL